MITATQSLSFETREKLLEAALTGGSKFWLHLPMESWPTLSGHYSMPLHVRINKAIHKGLTIYMSHVDEPCTHLELNLDTCKTAEAKMQQEWFSLNSSMTSFAMKLTK